MGSGTERLRWRPRIFISGPYISDPAVNTVKATTIGAELRKLGYRTLIPHYDHFMSEHFPGQFSEEEYLEHSLSWIGACDATFRFDPEAESNP